MLTSCNLNGRISLNSGRGQLRDHLSRVNCQKKKTYYIKINNQKPSFRKKTKFGELIGLSYINLFCFNCNVYQSERDWNY